ncbi:MAG: glycosyltransferase family 39 protein [Bacteroidetes bacterium]|nr:glycosyltransferase family 39 protein [Bacteroidota bacterium]
MKHLSSSFKSKTSLFLFQYRYAWCFLAIAVVYFFNLFIDVMDIDAAQYFSTSREMLATGRYLQVYSGGNDYLDKPPMLFWLSALSFKLFGIHNFSYKIPAILMLVLAIYATYQFTKEWYNKQTAVVAALVLCSTQGFFLMSNDVRTDGVLTGFLMCAIWQLSLFIKKARLKNLCWGALALGGAMLTKGPIALVIAGFAIGGDLLLKRKWNLIFNWRWLLMLGIIIIVLLPMCYGLYMQFDLHPEKNVYGLQGPSGIKFFFWTQSFGRITGDIYWDNGAGFFFLFHTILWDFAPWIVFLIPALLFALTNIIKTKGKASSQNEYISFFGFILSLLAISCSSFKLPHYVFPLFPMAAVLTAHFIVWIYESKKKAAHYVSRIFFGLMNLFFLAPFLCFLFIFPPPTPFLPVFIFLLYFLFWYLFLKTQSLDALLLPAMLACFVFGLTMAVCFYPNLLQYQAEGQAGKEAFRRNTPEDMFYYYNTHSLSMDAYAQRYVSCAQLDSLPRYKKGTLIYTDSLGMKKVMQHGNGAYKLIRQYKRFYVTALDIRFIIKETRPTTLEKRYLLQKE